MSVAIIIGAHGSVAEQLLKTTEMILGSQNNVTFIDFIPGENTETLINKYTDCLKALNTKSGVLFLVDTWGGSPFNAASRIVTNKKDHEILTGVNIPMLIEVFMTRDDKLSFKELVNTIIEAGRTGIRSLKTIEKKQIVSSQTNNIASVTPIVKKFSEHMNIILARIDDRLIHGQVATCWTKETNIKRIIVVSDEVASDNIRKTLIIQVAPPGVTAHVVNIAKAILVYKNPKYANDRVMLLFTNPIDVLRLIDSGVIINTVNIGGMAFRQGKIQVNNAVSLDKEDIEAFKKLNEYGIELEIRKVPNDSKLDMMELIKKIDIKSLNQT